MRNTRYGALFVVVTASSCGGVSGGENPSLPTVAPGTLTSAPRTYCEELQPLLNDETARVNIPQLMCHLPGLRQLGAIGSVDEAGNFTKFADSDKWLRAEKGDTETKTFNFAQTLRFSIASTVDGKVDLKKLLNIPFTISGLGSSGSSLTIDVTYTNGQFIETSGLGDALVDAADEQPVARLFEGICANLERSRYTSRVYQAEVNFVIVASEGKKIEVNSDLPLGIASVGFDYELTSHDRLDVTSKEPMVIASTLSPINVDPIMQLFCPKEGRCGRLGEAPCGGSFCLAPDVRTIHKGKCQTCGLDGQVACESEKKGKHCRIEGLHVDRKSGQCVACGTEGHQSCSTSMFSATTRSGKHVDNAITELQQVCNAKKSAPEAVVKKVRALLEQHWKSQRTSQKKEKTCTNGGLKSKKCCGTTTHPGVNRWKLVKVDRGERVGELARVCIKVKGGLGTKKEEDFAQATYALQDHVVAQEVALDLNYVQSRVCNGCEPGLHTDSAGICVK